MTAPGTEVAIRHPLEVIASDEFKAKVANALPDRREVERFTRVALTALQITPDLMRPGANASFDQIKAHQSSLLNSLLRCAQDGLLPDGREAALVMFGDTVQYMPMVTGLRKRAAEFGISIAAHVVCANDTFDYELGFEPTVSHKPPSLDKERGNPIGAYAVATDSQGRKYLEVMSRGEIEKVRAVSRAKSSGPWNQWWEEMARKTVARRLFKSLPLHEEGIASLLEAVDAEFDHGTAEQAVDRGLGYVGPPADDSGPDDRVDGHEVIDVEAVDVTESAGEPEDVEGASGAEAPDGAAVAQADEPHVEPASPAETVVEESGQTTFEQMAARAQKAKLKPNSETGE